jgi:Holliday junction DNA helicase RuvA
VYEYLIGRVAIRGATRLVLDVGGIGYDVAVPLGADFRADGETEQVHVWTHLVVRDDAHLLFGFPGREMRETFRLLLKVRGVGPGLAQGILSSLTESELFEAIAAEDARPLTRIKGVGKKTADQIVLDLRDRVPQFEERDGSTLVPVGSGGSTPGRTRTIADAIAALSSIGYSDKQAKASVERAAKKTVEDDELDLEVLVRAALRE